MDLASLFESLRNKVGKAKWDIGRDNDVTAGHDPRLTEWLDALTTGGEAPVGGFGLSGMLKASHGSPHAFDRFDFGDTKMGTGEGAQMYGHGGYFAQGFDSPVAVNYAPRDPKFEDAIMRKYNAAERAGDYPAMEIYEQYLLHDTPGSISKYIDNLHGEYQNPDPQQQKVLQQMRSAHQIGEKLYGENQAGHLYNVELKWPDAAREASDPLGEHHLLDWDALLKDQPEHLQAAIEDLKKRTSRSFPGIDWDNVKGQGLYSAFSSHRASPGAASEGMMELGIPGLKYLDQGSRNAANGSRNYVIFDENVPNIVTRNARSLTDLLGKK